MSRNYSFSVYREIQRAQANHLNMSEPKKCADYLDSCLFKPNLTKLKGHIVSFYQENSMTALENNPIQKLFDAQESLETSEALQVFLDFIAKRFKKHISREVYKSMIGIPQGEISKQEITVAINLIKSSTGYAFYSDSYDNIIPERVEDILKKVPEFEDASINHQVKSMHFWINNNAEDLNSNILPALSTHYHNALLASLNKIRSLFNKYLSKTWAEYFINNIEEDKFLGMMTLFKDICVLVDEKPEKIKHFFTGLQSIQENRELHCIGGTMVRLGNMLNFLSDYSVFSLIYQNYKDILASKIIESANNFMPGMEIHLLPYLDRKLLDIPHSLIKKRDETCNFDGNNDEHEMARLVRVFEPEDLPQELSETLKNLLTDMLELIEKKGDILKPFQDAGFSKEAEMVWNLKANSFFRFSA